MPDNSSLPLDEAAFFDLMAPALPEMAARQVERDAELRDARVNELAARKNWDWMTKLPPATLSPARGSAKSEFQAYLQRYIDQMDELRKAGGSEVVFGVDHPAAIYGDKLKMILETQRLTHAAAPLLDAAADALNRQAAQWQAVPFPGPAQTGQGLVAPPGGWQVGGLSDFSGLSGLNGAWGKGTKKVTNDKDW